MMVEATQTVEFYRGEAGLRGGLTPAFFPALPLLPLTISLFTRSCQEANAN